MCWSLAVEPKMALGMRYIMEIGNLAGEFLAGHSYMYTPTKEEADLLFEIMTDRFPGYMRVWESPVRKADGSYDNRWEDYREDTAYIVSWGALRYGRSRVAREALGENSNNVISVYEFAEDIGMNVSNMNEDISESEIKISELL